MSLGKYFSQNELRIVCILILIDKDVFEFILIVFANRAILLEKMHGLHNDIIEVNRIVLGKALLIELIDLANITGTGIS